MSASSPAWAGAPDPGPSPPSAAAASRDATAGRRETTAPWLARAAVTSRPQCCPAASTGKGKTRNDGISCGRGRS